MPGVTRLSVRNIRKSFGTHEVLRGISSMRKTAT